MAAVVKQSYWKRTLGGFFGNGNANLKADSEQDWSSFHRVTVTYAFGKRLTFSGLKRYLTIGQLRELVAAQLLLPADFVGLQCEGEQLLINSMTLEDAMQGRTSLMMSYFPPGSRHFPYSILWGFSVHSERRRFFMWFIQWPWFEGVSLALIVLNTLFMCLSDPLDRDDSGLQVFIKWTDPVFTVLFTIEMACKIAATGILLDPHSYLRDGWNWIDAAVVVVAWITFESPGASSLAVEAGSGEVIAAQTGGSAATALKPIRTVRVLRPLRTVTRVRGMRVVVQSLLNSVPEMASVILIMSFIFVFFGIFGVQLFSGALRWRCVDESIAVEPCSYNRSLTDAFSEGPACFPSNFSDDCAAAWLQATATDSPAPNCLPLWADGSQLGDMDTDTCDGQVPDSPGTCGGGGRCTYFSSNPNNNVTNFDAFHNAFVTIFYSLTLEGWVDTMYMLMDSKRVLAWLAVIYFIAFVLIGSVFVYNLLLAVVFDNFANTNAEALAMEEDRNDEMDEAEMAGLIKDVTLKDATALELDMETVSQKKKAKKKPKRMGGMLGGMLDASERALQTMNQAANQAAKLTADVAEKAKATVSEGMQKIDDLGTAMDNSMRSANQALGLEEQTSRARQVVESDLFERFIIAAILANTVMMAIDWEPPPFGMSKPQMRYAQFIASALFCSIFTLEFLMKLYALGRREYFGVKMNCFDFVIVVVSIIEFGVQVSYLNSSDTSSAAQALSVLRTLKGLRTLRLLRLLNLIAGMRKVVLTMSKSAEHILYLFMILVLFWIIFALLGMETMAQPMVTSKARFSFKSFYYAIISVFVVTSGENWNDLLTEGYAYVGPWAMIYFILLLVMANWIILNLFIAILLSNINDLSVQEARSKAKLSELTIKKLRNMKKTVSKKINAPGALSRAGTAFFSRSGGSFKQRPTLEKGSSQTQTVAKPKRLSMFFLLFSCGRKRNPWLADPDEKELPTTFRGWMKWTAQHHHFNAVIQFLIFMSSFTLVIDLPGTLTAQGRIDAAPSLQVLEYVFNVLFTFEALVKIAGYGPGDYFRSASNLLDFTVVAIGWMTIALDNLSDFAFLRALRSVRMLKLASLNEGMQVAIVSLYYSLPAVLNVMMVLFLYLIIFGILGMQTNAGRWGFCDKDLLDEIASPYDASNRTFNFFNPADCRSAGGEWINPTWGHMDDIFNAMLVLFETSTLEQWPDIFVYMNDASWDQSRALYTPPIPAPGNEISLFSVFFWFVWIFVSAFIIMNLFVGVVVETFQRNKEKEDGTIFLTERQQKWVQVMMTISPLRANRLVPPPPQKWRRPYFKFATSQQFELVIILTIIISVICMATNAYDMTIAHVTALSILNFIFCGIFFLEMCVKLIGLGPKRYFMDGWNCFDFTLVVFSIFDLLLEVLNINSVLDPVFLRAFRLVRVGRLLRLIRGFKSILRMLDTLVLSLPSLLNVMALLSLLLVIYAIAGVSLFHNVNPVGAQYLDYDTGGYVSFQNFGISLLTLFRCVTGESWNGVMHDLMINNASNPHQCDLALPTPRKCGEPVSAGIYFVTFTIFATFMLLNLLIGVILQNFSNTLASGSIRCITLEQIALFTQTWQLFDPTGTHMIPKVKLPMFLLTLRAHSWVYNRGADVPVSMGETIDLIALMRVPEHRGQVNFQETLQGIARAIHHGFKEARLSEVGELDKPMPGLKGNIEELKMNDNLASATTAEVARARAKMRSHLEKLRRKSYVRTGLLSRTVMPVQEKAAFAYGARMVQMRLRHRKMKAELLKQLKRGEIHAEQSDVYFNALEFLYRVKHFKIISDAKRAQKNFIRRIEYKFKTMGRPKPPPEDVLMDEKDILSDKEYVALKAWAEKEGENRPPMTTTYAAHIIQTRRRAVLEMRAYRWLKVCVAKLQAVWRGRAWRKQKAAEEIGARLLQNFFRERRVLKSLPWGSSDSRRGSAAERRGSTMAVRHAESIKFRTTSFEL